MLSNKPSLGFHNVLRFNFAVPAFLILMCVTTFGAVDSRNGLPESFKEVFGLEYAPYVIAIYGTVTYENAASPTVHIYNADVCADTTNCVLSNDTDDDYSVTVTNGYHTVCASKTPSTDYSHITAYDAALISAHVSGTPLLTTTPLRMAADVTRGGSINSTDASRVSNYVVQLTPYDFTGKWEFWVAGNAAPWPPASIPEGFPYCHVDLYVISGYGPANFTGILYGDVDGNWDGTDPRPGPGNNTMAVGLPRMAASQSNEIVVPVNVQGIADKNIIAYQFDLRYDPLVLKPKPDLVSLARTASNGFNYSVNVKEPGLIRLAVYGIRPIEMDGVLLNLRFTATNAPGAVSPLTLENVLFNESTPGTIANGQVRLSSADSTTATD